MPAIEFKGVEERALEDGDLVAPPVATVRDTDDVGQEVRKTVPDGETVRTIDSDAATDGTDTVAARDPSGEDDTDGEPLVDGAVEPDGADAVDDGLTLCVFASVASVVIELLLSSDELG